MRQADSGVGMDDTHRHLSVTAHVEHRPCHQRQLRYQQLVCSTHQCRTSTQQVEGPLQRAAAVLARDFDGHKCFQPALNVVVLPNR